MLRGLGVERGLVEGRVGHADAGQGSGGLRLQAAGCARAARKADAVEAPCLRGRLAGALLQGRRWARQLGVARWRLPRPVRLPSSRHRLADLQAVAVRLFVLLRACWAGCRRPGPCALLLACWLGLQLCPSGLRPAGFGHRRLPDRCTPRHQVSWASALSAGVLQCRLDHPADALAHMGGIACP